MEETKKLLPQVPVLTEYKMVKDELKSRIKKLNEITVLTEDNKKEVKSAISEINKVKDRVSRFRIDETAKFLEYINPYIEQCKELEKLWMAKRIRRKFEISNCIILNRIFVGKRDYKKETKNSNN